VLMLVFKDSILGFVASVQIAGNDMVREGDWIEMPDYGADGDVLEISLTTVKVQNWNKTITTIPTYALVSNAFKNWRGMSESEGRRIKRALYIDMASIRFLDEPELERDGRVQLLQRYLASKRSELTEHNAQLGADLASPVNGRRLTNVGTLRAYVEAYLRAHPRIHQGMTPLVRQLEPTEKGLPLELYAFSKEQRWAQYEALQADLFDHLLAVLPEFGLRVVQMPTGADVRAGLTDAGARRAGSA
jgi:miniconductance mechanosensitive channel